MRVSAFIMHSLAAKSVNAGDAASTIDRPARNARSPALEEIGRRLRLIGEPDAWKAINERFEARRALERGLSP